MARMQRLVSQPSVISTLSAAGSEELSVAVAVAPFDSLIA